MPGPWGLTPADLQQARAHSLETAASISAQLSALTSYVDVLCTEWLGVSSRTFLDLMNDYNTHATSLQQTLENIATRLQNTHNAVVDTESTNLSLLTPHSTADVNLRPPRF